MTQLLSLPRALHRLTHKGALLNDGQPPNPPSIQGRYPFNSAYVNAIHLQSSSLTFLEVEFCNLNYGTDPAIDLRGFTSLRHLRIPFASVLDDGLGPLIEYQLGVVSLPSSLESLTIWHTPMRYSGKDYILDLFLDVLCEVDQEANLENPNNKHSDAFIQHFFDVWGCQLSKDVWDKFDVRYVSDHVALDLAVSSDVLPIRRRESPPPGAKAQPAFYQGAQITTPASPP
ncbi:hypothetical protein BJX64DRAFT_291182 [Aspergillus heterothallicus]